jgi:hypothetical protein
MPRVALTQLHFHLSQLIRSIVLPIDGLAHHQQAIGPDHALLEVGEITEGMGGPGYIHAALAQSLSGTNPVLLINEFVERKYFPGLRVSEVRQAFSGGPA